MEVKLIPSILIGISGDSGVGKTTITSMIQEVIGQNCVVLNGDNYHKWERGDIKWKNFTHLNIHANRLDQAYKDLMLLKSGKEISSVVYNHVTGKFSNSISIKPKNVIIYEGLHSFFPEEINELYDLRIYVKADEPLRRHWKINRDMIHRGYSKEKVLQQIESRSNDCLNYIQTQEKFGDIVIHHQLKHNINSFMQLLGDETLKAEFETKTYCLNKAYSNLLEDGSDLKDQIQTLILGVIKQKNVG